MTVAYYEVPLSAEAQRFTISLNGTVWQLTLAFCPPANYWLLSIADQNGVAVISSIPLITGKDLLEPYTYAGIGGALVCQTDTDALAVPTFDNLGITSHLYFIVESV
jgi:hypothetical protein